MILFFGPAGSGKSAQAQLLVDNQGWIWLSMGQLLRDTSDSEVHEFQRKGILVPFEKVNQVLDEALVQITANQKVILDGYPRQIDQAQRLVEYCKSHGLPIELAINFDVNMEELLKRMELRGRDDDTPESINERLAIYHKEIDPILNLLVQDGIKVVHVDGVGTFEQIHDRVIKELTACKLA
jgi:adenylate kinase